MAKEKKISVKYIPRKNKEKDSYSVYFRVFYDQNSTVVPTKKTFPASSLKDAKKILESDKNFGKIYLKSFDPRLIISVVRNEIKITGEQYSISGFSDRWRLYCEPIALLFTKKFNEKVLKNLENILTYSSFNDLLYLLSFVEDHNLLDEGNYPDPFSNSIFAFNQYEKEVKSINDTTIAKTAFTIAAFSTFLCYYNMLRNKENQHNFIIADWVANTDELKQKFKDHLYRNGFKGINKAYSGNLKKLFVPIESKVSKDEVLFSFSKLIDFQLVKSVT